MNVKNGVSQEHLSPLTPERVLDLWSRTYNTQGKPDWSHIFPYYHENILFQDPVQKLMGRPAFIAMCDRLAKRCKELKMDITAITANDRHIFFQWTMTMVFRRTPRTSLYGASLLTLDEDGRIIRQRDYYDLWGDIFRNVPVIKSIYPRFMRRLFG